MAETPISLLDALKDGWNWMVTMLFRPFDLGKWFVVGFSAWLAGLANWSGGSGGGQVSDDHDGRHVFEGAQNAWDWVSRNEWIVLLLVGGCLVVLGLIVLVLWLSSRAKFIFLDNVVHNRAAIVEPWKRYRRLGNSLFVFRLVAGLISIPLSLGFVGLFLWLAVGPDGWIHLDGAGVWIGALATAFGALFLIVATIFTFFFLDAFVVPLMHRFDLGVIDGWRRFLPTLQERPFWFFGAGLFVFALTMLAFAVIVTTGLMTCCLGFLLLAIPYIGTVILLPLIVTYRAFTVAFLAQFEPELRLGGSS